MEHGRAQKELLRLQLNLLANLLERMPFWRLYIQNNSARCALGHSARIHRTSWGAEADKFDNLTAQRFGQLFHYSPNWRTRKQEIVLLRETAQNIDLYYDEDASVDHT